MIRVFARKNYLAKDNTNPFVFHSRTLNTLTEDALVEKMQEYNSTLTEAEFNNKIKYYGYNFLIFE